MKIVGFPLVELWKRANSYQSYKTDVSPEDLVLPSERVRLLYEDVKAFFCNVSQYDSVAELLKNVETGRIKEGRTTISLTDLVVDYRSRCYSDDRVKIVARDSTGNIEIYSSIPTQSGSLDLIPPLEKVFNPAHGSKKDDEINIYGATYRRGALYLPVAWALRNDNHYARMLSHVAVTKEMRRAKVVSSAAE